MGLRARLIGVAVAAAAGAVGAGCMSSAQRREAETRQIAAPPSRVLAAAKTVLVARKITIDLEEPAQGLVGGSMPPLRFGPQGLTRRATVWVRPGHAGGSDVRVQLKEGALSATPAQVDAVCDDIKRALGLLPPRPVPPAKTQEPAT